jgi:hypothetical protein
MSIACLNKNDRKEINRDGQDRQDEEILDFGFEISNLKSAISALLLS